MKNGEPKEKVATPPSTPQVKKEYIPPGGGISLNALDYNLKNPIARIPGIRLNIGCGNDPRASWINIDKFNTKYVDMVADIRELPFADNSIAQITAYEVLEHLPMNDLLQAAKEMYRVLKKDGDIYTIVPDLVSYCQNFINNADDDWAIFRIYGSQETEGQFHRSGFTPQRLFRLYGSVGFRSINTARIGDGGGVLDLFTQAIK